MISRITKILVTGLPIALLAAFAWAQETDTEVADATDTAADVSGNDGLLTDAELQTLVAPVALYPDTLLIQILVAATEPLEVVKANRYLIDNAERDADELKPEIEAMGWDESVTVLATAFPEVIGQMATHIDWTETIGTAMLAQSDDVMDNVQVMRNQAIDSGALLTGEEQSVEVTEDEDVVITPTDPNVVYVPQYDPQVVYVDDPGVDAGDVVGGVLLTFLGFAIIDEIFDDDDDWYGYWGCRNCGGWGGRPIIRNPDIDIDIDGDVNIGNRPDVGWKPDDDRRDEARDRLENRPRGEGGPQTLPVERPANRQDELRGKLSSETGARDISRDGAAAAAAAAGAGAGAALGNRAARPATGATAGGDAKARAKAAALDGTHKGGAGTGAVKSRPKTAPSLPQARPGQPSGARGGAFKAHSGGAKARSASSRGKALKRR
ncbi:MAG: DUF3300 domain-containing protein [Pseudomonadota bacterium]